MIPKKIHYVWVGGKEKPDDIKKCMETWATHLSDYEIIEWNEQNFDMTSHPFIQQAYQAKKWAFVSDYIRAYVIYHYGGIYLDTDVIVLNNFESFLQYRAFVGFETPDYPFTAVFGAEPQHPLLHRMLTYYDEVSFEFDAADQFKNVNTKTVSAILVDEFGCRLGNERQTLREGIEVFPDYVLCNPSRESVTIHVFTGTWMETAKPLLRKINKFLKLRIKTAQQAAWFRRWVMRKRD